MAKTKRTNPLDREQKLKAAVFAVATRDGIGTMSARSVAAEAEVPNGTAHPILGSMEEARERLIRAAFAPIRQAFSLSDLSSTPCTLDIMVAPLRADEDLPVLVTQAASYSGLYGGSNWRLAAVFDQCWELTRTYLAEEEIPRTYLKMAPDPLGFAGRLISIYFAAALIISRHPDITAEQLRRDCPI